MSDETEPVLYWNGQKIPLPPATPPEDPEDENFDLRQLLAVARRRSVTIVTVSLAIASGVVARLLTQTPIYEGKFQLLVEPVTGQDRLERLEQALYEQTNRGSANKFGGLDYATQIDVLRSYQLLFPIYQTLQDRYPDLTYEALLERLEIDRNRETKILDISYQDSDPQKVQFAIEQIAERYINYSLAEQRTGTNQGLQFVDQQLPLLRARANELQAQLQTFQQQYDIIDTQQQGRDLAGRLEDLIKQRKETQADLGETESMHRNLQQQLKIDQTQAIALTALSEAPRYQNLLAELQEIDSQLAEALAAFTEESAIVQDLQDQRDRLLPLLEQEAQAVLGAQADRLDNRDRLASPNSIRTDLTQNLVQTGNQLKALQARAAALAAAERQTRQQIDRFAQISRQYTDLQRELEVATESLNRFLQVQENLQIESAQKVQPWQLISDLEVGEDPISPNIPRTLFLGAIAALVASTGAALLAEKLDNTFYSVEDLQHHTQLPLLGTIPFTRQLKGARVSPQPAHLLFAEPVSTSPFLEAFLSLHANLAFLSPDRPLRSFAISSSSPAEGRTTVALYLARAAAAMGDKVLLVDADLRHPQIHKLADLPNVWGLSHAVSSDLELESILQVSPVEENLSILTAGQIPPNPTRLLSSQKMRGLIQNFQEKFDLVIFDTPPLLGFIDAKLLAAQTDGMVLVVGLDRAERDPLAQAVESLKLSKVALLGAIANRAKDSIPGSSEQYRRYYKPARGEVDASRSQFKN
ncbi:MAG: polysaccharide biosynthesis tyrosine autokinase [Cyanobacteriota bacterium]|nr:polysaccharide biosynthesis tyrosine autokinase [Cyanobacteriota bacterium]